MLFEFHYPTGRTVRMYPGNAKEAGVWAMTGEKWVGPV